VRSECKVGLTNDMRISCGPSCGRLHNPSFRCPPAAGSARAEFGTDRPVTCMRGLGRSGVHEPPQTGLPFLNNGWIAAESTYLCGLGGTHGDSSSAVVTCPYLISIRYEVRC
jgi:hypothetical protein